MSRRPKKTYPCPNCGRVCTSSRRYVAHLLIEAKDKGVTTSDFVRWGAGIRAAARINELRDLYGWDIETRQLHVGEFLNICHQARSLKQEIAPRNVDGAVYEYCCYGCFGHTAQLLGPVCELCGRETRRSVVISETGTLVDLPQWHLLQARLRHEKAAREPVAS